jgi:DNA helicase HerA-like ATPase
VLLDIAERGRSLGVVLVGAQQTASEVERRIVVNSAIKVVGRLDAAEASRPEYGFLPQAQRQRALIAKPGTMFINQPDIPVPLVAEFPFPAWATRPGEAGAAPSATVRSLVPSIDPFAVVGAARNGREANIPDDEIPF